MDLIRSRPDTRDDTKEARRAHHRMDLIGRDPRQTSTDTEEARHAHHRMDLIRSRPDFRDDTKEAQHAHHRMDLNLWFAKPLYSLRYLQAR